MPRLSFPSIDFETLSGPPGIPAVRQLSRLRESAKSSGVFSISKHGVSPAVIIRLLKMAPKLCALANSNCFETKFTGVEAMRYRSDPGLLPEVFPLIKGLNHQGKALCRRLLDQVAHAISWNPEIFASFIGPVHLGKVKVFSWDNNEPQDLSSHVSQSLLSLIFPDKDCSFVVRYQGRDYALDPKVGSFIGVIGGYLENASIGVVRSPELKLQALKAPGQKRQSFIQYDFCPSPFLYLGETREPARQTRQLVGAGV